MSVLGVLGRGVDLLGGMDWEMERGEGGGKGMFTILLCRVRSGRGGWVWGRSWLRGVWGGSMFSVDRRGENRKVIHGCYPAPEEIWQSLALLRCCVFRLGGRYGELGHCCGKS